jgi:hypothetical protein
MRGFVKMWGAITMETPRSRDPNQERTVIIQNEALKQWEGGFTAIPNRILENPDLSLGARMVYAMLLKYAWQKDFCFPAQERLADDLGIGTRSVRTYLNELREAKLIKWRQQGLNRPNVYFILELPRVRPESRGNPGPANFAAPDRQNFAGQDRQETTYKEHSSKYTHNNVNVGENRIKAVDNSLSDEEIKEDDLVDQLMEQLGDTNPKSRKAYRLIIRTLGTAMVWRLLGNVKEAARDGLIHQSKAAYFMGHARNTAREQGVPLEFRSARS